MWERGRVVAPRGRRRRRRRQHRRRRRAKTKADPLRSAAADFDRGRNEQGGDDDGDELAVDVCAKCGRDFLSVPRTEVCNRCRELPMTTKGTEGCTVRAASLRCGGAHDNVTAERGSDATSIWSAFCARWRQSSMKQSTPYLTSPTRNAR